MDGSEVILDYELIRYVKSINKNGNKDREKKKSHRICVMVCPLIIVLVTWWLVVNCLILILFLFNLLTKEAISPQK